jgi:tetratricopeptide (TPR) repeat protein
MKFAAAFKTLLVLLLLALLASGNAFAARKEKQEKAAPMFPDATRVDPKIKPVSSLAKQMQKLNELSQEDKNEAAIAEADKILASKKVQPYEKSFALQAKGFAYINLDADKDTGAYDRAIPLFVQTIETDGLPNDMHYQIMYQVSQMYMADEKYADALKWMDRFMAETKSAKPEHLAMKGNALYRLDRFDEAATFLKQAIAKSDKPQDAWNQLLMATYFDQDKPLEAAKIAEGILAKSPNDKKTLLNLSSIYAQAEQYDKAIEILERGRAAGMLTEERDYRQLFALYLNSEGKEAQGIAVIEEGMAKGILKPSAETYNALAQAYYFTDKLEKSIDAYKKAAPLAKDGETHLNLARVLTNEERYAEAKAAAQEALKKGVKKPGDAWMVIGRSEFGLNNKAGLVAAYKEAAKYPETKQQAEEWLRKNGTK